MDISQKIEALLFVHGDRMKVRKISRILAISEKECGEGLSVLEKRLASSGLELILRDGTAQMVTKKEAHDAIDQYLEKERSGPLTPVALEVLAIIAYRGPLSRAHIEAIRGVNCAYVLRRLAMRGLISKSKEAGSTAVVYAVSADCLNHLGIKDPSELPQHEEISTDKRISALLDAEGSVGGTDGEEEHSEKS